MSHGKRVTPRKALADLLRAVNNGWLDSTWPDNTIGKEAGKTAVQQAREIFKPKETQSETIAD